MVDINDYTEEKSCVYRGEEYLVRDNGAVLRKSIPQKRKRSYDNEWTFGKPNANGYLVIASVPIHRIVATAFHGAPPTEEHVVDHKDTNKQNNRPQNLRWLTRLENALMNEFTRKKIEYITGVSIYEFLKNPTEYKNLFSEPNYSWMRTVTPEEAKHCLETLKTLFEKEKATNKSSSKLGEWVYGTQTDRFNNASITDSLTPLAKQRNWSTPTEFVCCPKTIADSPLENYFENLSLDAVFCSNQYGTQKIVKYALVGDDAIIVMSDIAEASGVKNYALAKITFENGYYLHIGLGTFSSKDGAEKYFRLEQCLEWSGGEVFDDYC